MPFDPVSYTLARRALSTSLSTGVLNSPPPAGLYKTFTAGTTITAGQVVSLHIDGKIYPSSPSYPNIVGVAIDSADTGGGVRVIALGVTQVVADGPVNVGDPLTFSPTTPGRVVSYGGHSHEVSLSTSQFITNVGIDTSYSISTTGILTHTHTVSTGSAVTGVSVAAAINRVLGVALTSATAAGQTITVLVHPSRG
jgi:hypothetical protein